jgi:predicted pyridoxine 5'-phosphate oxidase superfamily flavin-nucleotide-binding protein
MTAARHSPRVERGWARDASPFHPGEQAVQHIVGVRDQVERAGRNMIREQLPDPFRALFNALPMVVVGSLGAAGQVWASILSGAPGFVHSPESNLLQVNAQPVPGDPLANQLEIGAPLGVLGIQLETRRRVRANGRVISRTAAAFTVHVEQTFGNCNQYIQAREPTFEASLVGTGGAPVLERARLSERASALLANTDTFFIATASANAASTAGAASASGGEGVDVSHRGGRPGFVRVAGTASRTTLTFPDFSGNFMFNTLGNLQANPHAGIACADFSTGNVLCITGTASTIWEGPELAAFEGAERLLEFNVTNGVFLERALPLRFSDFSASPSLIGTGTWPTALPPT